MILESMKKLYTLAFCILAIPIVGQSQDNPRIANRDGIIITGGGPGAYGSLSYDRFLSPNINFEIGAGPATLFTGINYHYGGESMKNWTPYLGGYLVYIWIFDIFPDDDNLSSVAGYIPVGLRLMSGGGFSMAFEGGVFVGVGDLLPFGGVKVGYMF